MKDYLKQFNTTAEYNTYINGTPDLPNVSLTLDDNEVHYNPKPDYSKEYFTTEALESGTFSCAAIVQYSIDGGTTWQELGTNNSLTVAQGDKIMWKGEANWNGKKFNSTCRFNAYGNVMSLMYGDNFIGQTTFPSGFVFQSGLFYQNNNLVSAENLILPATTLVTSCYNYMFYGCTSLITAPALPAATLTSNCYTAMFANCTSLTAAPELPATTLAYNCYKWMFQHCTSLTTAPSILPSTTLTVSCYEFMFNGCTSLTTAPELPATILQESCYKCMFWNCSNLNNIKMLATNISAYDCLSFWVNGVAATGTFTKAASMTSLPTGNNGIPANWTVVDA